MSLFLSSHTCQVDVRHGGIAAAVSLALARGVLLQPGLSCIFPPHVALVRLTGVRHFFSQIHLRIEIRKDLFGQKNWWIMRGKHGQSRQSLLENVPVGELFAEVPIHSTHTTCQCLFLWGGCLSVFHCHIYRRTLSPSSPLSSPEKSEITDQICVPLNKHMFCFWRQLCHCCTVPPSTDWRRRAADGGWEGGWVQESVWLFPPPLQQRHLDWRQISRRLLWSWKRRAFPCASGLQCVDFLKERDHL